MIVEGGMTNTKRLLPIGVSDSVSAGAANLQRDIMCCVVWWVDYCTHTLP